MKYIDAEGDSAFVDFHPRLSLLCGEAEAGRGANTETRLTGAGLGGLAGITETDADAKCRISSSEVDVGAQAADGYRADGRYAAPATCTELHRKRNAQ